MRSNLFTKMATIILFAITASTTIVTSAQAEPLDPLHFAILNDDVRHVESLLQRGYDANGGEEDSLLALASRIGNLPIVHLLIEHGATSHRKKKSGRQILIAAVNSGNVELVEYLLGQKLKFEKSWKVKIDIGGISHPVEYHLMSLGVKSNSVEMIRFLESKGISVKTKVGNKKSPTTPLSQAALSSDGEVLDYLISQGADVNAKGISNTLPIHNIYRTNQMPFPGGKDPRSGLVFSQAQKSVERAQALVNGGADINQPWNVSEDNTSTLLNQAVLENNLELVKWLIKHGARTDMRSRSGVTILNDALDKSYAEMAFYLSQNGVVLGGLQDYDPLTILQQSLQPDAEFQEALAILSEAKKAFVRDPYRQTRCIVENTSVEWILIRGQCDERGYATGRGVARSISIDTNSTTRHLRFYVGYFEQGKFEDSHSLYEWGSILVSNYAVTDTVSRIYKGPFTNHQGDGPGTKWLYKGDRLLATIRGSFVNTLAQGQGVVTTPLGFRYEGEIKDDAFDGKGKMFDPYETEFVGGGEEPFGNVIASRYYEGDFANGKFAGQGKLIKSTGEQYAGLFRDGLYHGQGTWTHSNKMVYQGSFERGGPSGRGVAEWPDGRKFDGTFVSGGFSNFNSHLGIMTFPDGRRIKGYVQGYDYFTFEEYSNPQSKLAMLAKMAMGVLTSGGLTGNIDAMAQSFAKQTLNYSMEGLQRGLAKSGNGNFAQIVQMAQQAQGRNIDAMAQSLVAKTVQKSVQGAQTSLFGNSTQSQVFPTAPTQPFSTSATSMPAPNSTRTTSSNSPTFSSEPDSNGTRFFPHKIQCNDGQQHDVKIPYKSERCLFALKQFSEVMACNVVSKMQMAQEDCSRMCGRADCYEE